MNRLYIDIETNLAHDNIWCCCLLDSDGNSATFKDNAEELQGFINLYDEVVAHNGIRFDFPVLEKVWGVVIPPEKQRDTLVLSRLYNPNIEGGHSLKNLGKLAGVQKLDFDVEDFDSGLTDEMLEYCQRDVEALKAVDLWLEAKLKQWGKPEQSIELEHKVARLMYEQERNGFKLDEQYAVSLLGELNSRMAVIEGELQQVFPPIVTERFSEKTGKRLKDDVEVFNVGSRQQIAKRLQQKGAKFTKTTEKGSVIVDESVLSEIDIPEAKLCLEYLTIQKMVGMLNQWLDKLESDGRVRGKVNSNGAVTGRMTQCVPLTTQILTRTGWKYYSELTIGEEVLGFNLETGYKEWTYLKAVHKYHNAAVGSVGTTQRRLRCTEDHKWVGVRSPNKPYQRYVMVTGKELNKTTALLMNAPYNNNSVGGHFKVPLAKYDYNHCEAICNMNNSELNSFMLGFLLADGYLKSSSNGSKKSWSFAQAEGHILDAAKLAMFLYSSGRISQTCKSKLKGDNQRYGYNITETSCSWMRTGADMRWRYENNEDVWCPETGLGTWVMQQEDGIVAITGNSKPNMAQVPSVTSVYGKQARTCWTVDKGNKLVGCDLSGIELRCLAHYMQDDEWTKELLEGDIHTKNQLAAGLEERSQAKTMIYATLYGAGSAKIGSIVGGGRDRGKKIMDNFYKNTPALKKLKEKVTRIAAKGYLPALDNRRLLVRSEHSALNTLLQSAGAIVAKQWLVESDGLFKQHGITQYVKRVVTAHDEQQLEVKEEYAEQVGKLCVEAAQIAADKLGFRVRVDAEYKIGDNWLQTH